MLPPDRFDEAVFAELIREANEASDITAAPARLILPDDATPIDDLIDRVY